VEMGGIWIRVSGGLEGCFRLRESADNEVGIELSSIVLKQPWSMNEALRMIWMGKILPSPACHEGTLISGSEMDLGGVMVESRPEASLKEDEGNRLNEDQHQQVFSDSGRLNKARNRGYECIDIGGNVDIMRGVATNGTQLNKITYRTNVPQRVEKSYKRTIGCVRAGGYVWIIFRW
jgi:hypothetical protein